MRRPDVPLENIAEIVWGGLMVLYLLGSGRQEYLQPSVLAVFGLSAAAAFLELHLRRIGWRWLAVYDATMWTVLLSAMVAVTGGRGSELWVTYALMALTAPSLMDPVLHYGLLAVNSIAYTAIYTWVNPQGIPLNPSLLALRIGLLFLITYVVDQSMARERSALRLALEVVRSRIHELVRARDAERKRIAGDLHDWLGSGIIAPMRKLELAAGSDDLEEVRAHIGDALETLRRSHEELRRLMENLHPHLLEQMGLVEALRAYLIQWGEQHGVRTEFRCEPGPEPPPEVALTAYRIAQEALNNAAEHAAATRVELKLTLLPDRVGLVIRDDGKGFNPYRTPPPGAAGEARAAPLHRGRGLTGMSERAAIIGGNVTVTSAPGRGTAVEATLPHRRHLQAAAQQKGWMI